MRVEYERVTGTFGGTLTGLPGTDFGANELRAFRPGHVVMLQWTTVLGYRFDNRAAMRRAAAPKQQKP